MHKYKLIKLKSALLIGSLVLDGVFFMLTNAQEVSSLTLMFGFLLVVGTFYLLIDRFNVLIRRYILSTNNDLKSFKLLITGVVGAMLALQSLGELTLRDLLMSAPLTVILYAYMTYGRGKSKTQATQ